MRSLAKKQAQLKTEVRSVMEGLLKSVTKSLNQEEMAEKKLRRTESRVTKQVMEMLIKSVEGVEKQALKEKKQRQQEVTQIETCVENLIKKIETNVAPSKRKRKDGFGATKFDERGKTEKSADDQKPQLTNQSVIQAANQILEKVIGKRHGHVVQTVCTLLNKHGPKWIHVLRQEEADARLMTEGASTLDAEQNVPTYAAAAPAGPPIVSIPEPHISEPATLAASEEESTCEAESGSFPLSRHDTCQALPSQAYSSGPEWRGGIRKFTGCQGHGSGHGRVGVLHRRSETVSSRDREEPKETSKHLGGSGVKEGSFSSARSDDDKTTTRRQ